MDIPTWLTPAMVLASALWIVRQIRRLGERVALLEGSIVRWQVGTAGRADR